MADQTFSDAVIDPAPSAAPATAIQSPPLILYTDLMEFAQDIAGAAKRDGNLNLLKRACVGAFRKLIHERSWRYYYLYQQIVLDATYSTGTIAFDFTGGTYERQVTLTSGTWPDWTVYGRIKIGDVAYDIDEKKSSTVLTLSETSNPGQDVAALTTYTLFRDQYPLAGNFQKIYRPENEQGSPCTTYLEPHEWYAQQRRSNWSGQVLYWTITPDDDRIGGHRLVVLPYSTTVVSLGFYAQLAPRRLTIAGNETDSCVGTVSVTSGEATVTGSGTAFREAMEGSYLRLQTGSELPTGETGQNPYSEQHLILSVASATSLTLATTASATHTAKKYVISDPVDIARNMEQALYRGIEYELATLWGLDKLANYAMRYSQELTTALEWDGNLMDMGTAGSPSYPPEHHNVIITQSD